MTESPNSGWLQEVAGPLRRSLSELLVLSGVVNLLALAVPVFVLQVYDRVVFHAGLSTLQALVVGMAVVLLFDFLLRQTRSRVLNRLALRIDVEVGRKLFEKLVALPLATLESRTTAQWLQCFRDVETVRTVLAGGTALLVTDLPFAFLFMGLVVILAKPLAPVLALVLVAFVILAWWSGRAAVKAQAEERRAGVARETVVAEMIQGRGLVKALNLEEMFRDRWEGREAHAIEEALVRGRRMDSQSAAAHLLTMISTVSLTTVGALAILDQRLTVGQLVATNMLAGRLIAPFAQLVSSWRGFMQVRQALGRLGALFGEAEDLGHSAVALERPRGILTAENVIYRYRPDAPPVLKDVSVTLRPGRMIGLVGPNGCGKTTLLKLLQGLYRPEEGRVLLDNADIRQLGRADLARWVGYVPQDARLFDGTIRDNIAARDPGASDEDVVQAAKLASVHETILNLPDGYGSDIGEAGHVLSGGQRQKLAIARALLGDPPVLLLDEPSASLDRVSEEDLRQALETLASDHLVVVVSHAPALLSACREVVVMDQGAVTAHGPARSLLPRLFPRLFRQADSQAASDVEARR